MASSRKWRRSHTTKKQREAGDRRTARAVDAARCLLVDADGIRCRYRAHQFGYCRTHWSRA